MSSIASRRKQTTVTSHNDRASDNLQTLIVGAAIIFWCVTLAWLVFTARPVSLALRFNPFALLSVAALMSNLVALVLILRVKERSNALKWFALHLLSLALWAAAETMLRLSATPQAAAFWAPFANLGSVMMAVALYMFALCYTDSKQSQRPVPLLSVLTASMILFYADLHSHIINLYLPENMVLRPWGYVPQPGPAFVLVALWLVLLAAVALLMLRNFRRKTVDSIRRNQSRLFIIAIAIPLAGGALTDALLPALNNLYFPPLAVMLTAAMGLIISFGILRYNIFSFSPEIIADQIISTMNEAVIGTRPDLRLSYANKAAEDLFGFTDDNIGDHQLGDYLVHHHATANLQYKLITYFMDHDSFTIDAIDFRTNHKSIITAKLSVTKIEYAGHADGYLFVITDITAVTAAKALVEKQVAEQIVVIRNTEAKLTSSINSLEFGFVITDTRPEVITINDTAHQLFCGSNEHTAQTCTIVTLANIQKQFGLNGPVVKKIIDDCLSTQRLQGIRSVDFREHDWRVFVSPVLEGATTVGTTIIIQDITEQAIIERSKDEFFSIASHELRTPLTAIRGNASMMLEYYADNLKDPALHEIVDDIKTSSIRLISIVNDFLDSSRLEQGKMSLKPAAFDLIGVIESVADEMKAVMDEKRLYFHLNKDPSQKLPEALGDQNRIKQVIYNLVGNALKFTEVGGITITAEALNHELLRVTIADTGRGMNAEAQKLLFHKFQQAGNSLLTRDTVRGTGLGLYISKLIVEQSGGKLNLDTSAEGHGSAFAFTLPIATSDRLAQAAHGREYVNPQTGLHDKMPE